MSPSPAPILNYMDDGSAAHTAALQEKIDKLDCGSFSDVSGATSCCTCCSGFYQDQTGQTSCTICPAEGSFAQGYSDPGATDVDQCTAQAGAVATCDQDTSTGTCRKRFPLPVPYPNLRT
ncbi:hypothetical protein PUNSTDRAFT_135652 [Punctularia strigosozonata HHB-11173 SS5]|uniref:uncharacterized protein n=1 Tax=Punctularia strigosozonata (strain HHB-11173) TaxID=741275 RepID=UPI00044165E2|nr:uncharacterized protein PUNSTDRAFT_135652 [Punctularia strigosozonata HHB-11173 SS5]EIN06952.1 hypothetical protein PUNSTDRAFT_135652 [Punctularia strigosozonata HHB-11173 SS5]